jgi:uncharacterized protein YlxW (UPF0749 family)
MSLSLTVFFEDPFWVGLFSRSENDQSLYCRVVFGNEPADIEIYHFFLKHYYTLKFAAASAAINENQLAKNPKRRQREVRKNLQHFRQAKKSYTAIKKELQKTQQEKQQTARKQAGEKHMQYIFECKKLKQKAKHRGH